MLKPPPAIPGRKTKSGFEVFEGKRPQETPAEKKTKQSHDRILSGIAQRHLAIDDIHDTDTQDAPHTKSGFALHAALRAAFDAGRMVRA